jgi:hypothetical protein
MTESDLNGQALGFGAERVMRGGRAAIRLILMSGAPVHRVAARGWSDGRPFRDVCGDRGHDGAAEPS